MNDRGQELQVSQSPSAKASATQAPHAHAWPSPVRAWYAVGVFAIALMFNFLDRQILGILAGPITSDLKLTDAEFGAIAGLAFALLYSVLAVPLALRQLPARAVLQPDIRPGHHNHRRR